MSEGSCDLQSNLESDTGSFVKQGSEEFTDYDEDRLNINIPMVSPLPSGHNAKFFRNESPTDETTSTKTRSWTQYFAYTPAIKLHNFNIKHVAQVTIDIFWTAGKYTAEYLLILTMKTLSHLHQPLALLLSFYIFTLMASYISQRVFKGLTPICVIPGVSSLSICRLHITSPQRSGPNKDHATPNSPDYAMLMNTQSRSFESLLQELAGGAGLSLEIKKAEMATSDLVARVRLSELSSKDSMARALSDFIITARRTGRGLQRLTSKVGGSVDESVIPRSLVLSSVTEY